MAADAAMIIVSMWVAAESSVRISRHCGYATLQDATICIYFDTGVFLSTQLLTATMQANYIHQQINKLIIL